MSEKKVALKVGCGQFFYGEDMISQLAPSIKRFGGRALLLGGPSSVERVLNAIEQDLLANDIQIIVCKHTDPCTKDWADRYSQMAKDNGSTVIVGVGGGKVIDQAKAASCIADLPVITVPTSIATCVASSMVCIMYNEKGQRDGEISLEKEVEVCIADRALIAAAPKRFLAAGILDSMAKLPEVRQKVENCGNPTALQRIQIANSQGIWDYLTEHGCEVYDNLEQSEYFDEVILTNLLHTSVVSGFAAGGGQLAIAHAVYDGMRTYFTEDCKEYLHGELVAVGILIQMHYNGASSEELAEVKRMMEYMHMPMNLREMGFVPEIANIEKVYDILLKDTAITDEKRIADLKAAVDYAV